MNQKKYNREQDDSLSLFKLIEMPLFSIAKAQENTFMIKTSLIAELKGYKHQEPNGDIYGDNQW